MSLVIDLDSAFAESDFDNLENLMPFVSAEVASWRVDRARGQIVIELPASAERPSIEKKVRKLVAKVKPLRISPQPEYLVDCRNRAVPCQSDLFDLLVSRRDVIQHAPGIFSLHGKFQRMFSRLDGHLRALAESLHAEEAVYPVTIPLETLRKSKFFSHYP
ncbi:MAG: hypothetical protein WC003_14040 [Terrimicrobiaceae bacterium]